MFLETVAACFLAVSLMWILKALYCEFADRIDIPTAFGVAREILGGCILAATLYIEEDYYARKSNYER